MLLHSARQSAILVSFLQKQHVRTRTLNSPKLNSHPVFYSAALCRITMVLSSSSEIQQSAAPVQTCSHHVNLSLLLLLLSPQCAICTQPNLSHHHCKSETGHVCSCSLTLCLLLSVPELSAKIASLLHRLGQQRRQHVLGLLSTYS